MCYIIYTLVEYIKIFKIDLNAVHGVHALHGYIISLYITV